MWGLEPRFFVQARPVPYQVRLAPNPVSGARFTMELWLVLNLRLHPCFRLLSASGITEMSPFVWANPGGPLFIG